MRDGDFNIAAFQLTKEILDDLGIPAASKKANPNMLTQATSVIDEYAKYFRQLRIVLTTPGKE